MRLFDISVVHIPKIDVKEVIVKQAENEIIMLYQENVPKVHFPRLMSR